MDDCGSLLLYLTPKCNSEFIEFVCTFMDAKFNLLIFQMICVGRVRAQGLKTRKKG